MKESHPDFEVTNIKIEASTARLFDDLIGYPG